MSFVVYAAAFVVVAVCAVTLPIETRGRQLSDEVEAAPTQDEAAALFENDGL